ncbi:MAG: hypothetical protein PWQ61_3392 [Betaproteobacteria bacterium]|nr:hypothetical protein [Betaproteobacteria bacterium]
MANALYGKGKEKLLTAAINISSDTIKAALVSSAYTPNLATDEFYTTISGSVLNTPQTLASKTITLGVVDAADILYTAVTSGATAKAVVLYKDTGTGSTSALLAYIDTITGFPLATNGGDITITWDSGANKIFAL